MKNLKILLSLLAVVLFSQGCTSGPPAEAFNSPDEAVNAIIAAARAHDSAQLKTILGGGADDILSSGDPVADQNALDNFLAKYDEKHQLETESDGSVTVAVGSNDWPMPIPIVKDEATGKW